jgi:hypothetical protein
LTGPARPSRLPPHSLPHSVTRANPNPLSSLVISNRRRPRRSIPASSSGLRRRHVGHSLCLVKRFHPAVGIRRLRRRSSPSPPSVAQSILPSRLDLLRLGFARALPLLLSVCYWSLPPSPIGRRACNPGIAPRCGAVLGRSAVSTVMLLSVVATGRWLRRHNRDCADGVAAMVFLLAPLQAHL